MFSGSVGLNAGQFEVVYSKTGFTNWKAATIKFNTHRGSKCYLNSTTFLKIVLNPNSKSIDVILVQQKENAFSQKEINRLKSREMENKLIDIVLCLSIDGKPFHGRNEKTVCIT